MIELHGNDTYANAKFLIDIAVVEMIGHIIAICKLPGGALKRALIGYLPLAGKLAVRDRFVIGIFQINLDRAPGLIHRKWKIISQVYFIDINAVYINRLIA